MTQKGLERLAKWWLPRLCLSDWSVTVKIAPKADMADAEADIEVQPEIRHALVRICLEQQPDDVEQTLVHELLHIHFAPFARTGPRAVVVAQEAAIDGIARALVAVKRRRKKA